MQHHAGAVLILILRYEPTRWVKWLNFVLQVLTNDGTVVGKVSKQWSGVAREAFTDADNFGVNFPIDLDVQVKIVLLASVFLIVSSTVITVISKLTVSLFNNFSQFFLMN